VRSLVLFGKIENKNHSFLFCCAVVADIISSYENSKNKNKLQTLDA
jgi:hypothetical protein